MALSRASVAWVALAAATAVAVSSLLWSRRDAQTSPALSLESVLGDDVDAGFERALAPKPLAFPDDHGAHPPYKTEWWYFTGNLAASDGRRFGYQLTFFRFALSPDEVVEPRTAWATRQVYMAHFSLTDVDAGRFRFWERFGRGALGLAGSHSKPFRVWLDDWSVSESPGVFRDCAGCLALRLRARQEDVEVALELDSSKPAVLHGEQGLSRKSAATGNASYYYSLTRLQTRGRVRTGELSQDVRGTSWLDREWSTSALAPEQQGWDWFALQLDDGRELMFYRLRRKDGGVDPYSSGTLVAADGASTRLVHDEVAVEVLERWRSPATGVAYPISWRVRIETVPLDLVVRPLLRDQELNASFRYWEGAVSIRSAASPDVPIGHGYVELTGYD